MKKLFLFLFQFTLWCYPSESQIAIEWQKCYGGSEFNSLNEGLLLYPNPANETITIERKSSMNVPSSNIHLIKILVNVEN
jgi:hypothetical protein